MFIWETLYTLQGHWITPQVFLTYLSLSLPLTHRTQVIRKGHPAFSTFPMVPGVLAVSEYLSDHVQNTHTHTHAESTKHTQTTKPATTS